MAVVAKYHGAKRLACKASIAIDGLSGLGKTGLGLSLAYVLGGNSWDGVRALDTENKSMNLYVDTPLNIGVTLRDGELQKGDLTAKDGYKPSHYDAWRQAAIEDKGKAWLADSFSHLWLYKGGMLDMVNKEQRDNPKVNKYTVWGVPYIADEKNAIMDLVRHPDIHTIVTLRVKEKMEIGTDTEGKTVMKSLGEQQLVMPDFKYEPDLVLSIVEAGREDKAPVVHVEKSRYRIIKPHEDYSMTRELMEQLRLYLEEGTNPEELIEMQRQDYITAVKDFLDKNPNLKAIWDMLKENAGHKGTKLADLPLKDLKFLFGQLIAD